MKFAWNFENFEKDMVLTAYVFPKTEPGKDMVRKISTNSGFKIPFYSQHVKGYQTLLESIWQHFCNMFSSIWQKFSWKMSFLEKCKILRMFFNTLTTDNKVYLHRKNLPQPIQMQLSKKKKLFLNLLLHFWNLNQLLNFLKKNMVLRN